MNDPIGRWLRSITLTNHLSASSSRANAPNPWEGEASGPANEARHLHAPRATGLNRAEAMRLLARFQKEDERLARSGRGVDDGAVRARDRPATCARSPLTKPNLGAKDRRGAVTTAATLVDHLGASPPPGENWERRCRIDSSGKAFGGE